MERPKGRVEKYSGKAKKNEDWFEHTRAMTSVGARAAFHVNGASGMASNSSDFGGSGGHPRRQSVRETADRFSENLSNGVCSACNGYYGSAHGQPVCATCHAFLYANDLDAEVNLQLASVEQQGHDSDSDRDSGNDEPKDYFYARGASGGGGPPPAPNANPVPNRQPQVPLDSPDPLPAAAAYNLVPDYRVLAKNLFLDSGEDKKIVQHHLQPIKVESLSQRLAQLTLPRVEGDSLLPENLVDALPPEVLMVIFSFLDDISLYAVGNVCRRWQQLLVSQTTPEQWLVYTRRRWPLFRPMMFVNDWFSTYSTLVESSFCLTCIYQMAEVIPADRDPLPLREKRLGHDLRGLVGDPPEGIKAQPLDSSYYHWQASITGPAGSPYEGGVFFLYLKVPFTYPFDPPEVRFLTRIFHPNVSRHGDIGIDSIQQHNWVSGLTIPKVLISIQSLLTDPYTDVCMEPDIGRLYNRRRKMFDAVARQWTWKFAMWDALPAKRK